MTKLLRVTALAQKIIAKLRKTERNGQITPNDIDRAEKLWVAHVQRQHFGDVIQSIHKDKMNNLKSQLGIFIDKDGLLRCRGRLDNADVSDEAKTPLLLPKQDTFTQLIVERVHKRLLYSGVSHTLSQIRHTYWIPQGRSTVKTVLKRCILCRRHEGGPYKGPKCRHFLQSALQYLHRSATQE